MHGHMNVKLVLLVGFIIKKFVTMHGNLNVKSVSIVCNWMIVFLYDLGVDTEQYGTWKTHIKF